MKELFQSRIPASTFVTDRPVGVFVVFLALVVFGVCSLPLLPVTLMPEMSYPTLTVRTEFPGAAPEEVENEISRPIEEALGIVNGLKQISSISRSGVSDVVLEFYWGTAISDATQQVLEKLDLVFLPREAEKPLILHYDPSLDPVLELSLSGEGALYEGEAGLRRLRRLGMLQVKRALEPIKGVAAVRVRGGLEEEIHVMLDPEKLSQFGLSIQTVISRLNQENINVAGGKVREGRTEYMVRTLNEYRNETEIAETILKRVAGMEVRIRDVGEVSRDHKDREMVTRANGRESVQIDIFKEADANIVAVAKAVKNAIKPENKVSFLNRPNPTSKNLTLGERLKKEENVLLEVIADRSIFIESSIHEVETTALVGGVLAVVVLFLFLGKIGITAMVAISIPVSIFLTFAPMNWLGTTLNIMSLGGLALGVGMLVDSSIVVLESIFRCREEGDDLKRSAIRGTQEVNMAVIASTLTSVSVFFPMVFLEGIAGQAFGDLGMTVVVSLMASLLVALFLLPMLSSRTWTSPGGAGTHSTRKQYLPFSYSDYGSYRRWLETRSTQTKGWETVLFWPFQVVLLLVGSVLEFFGRLALWILTFLVGGIKGRWVGGATKKLIGFLEIPVGWIGAVLTGLTRSYSQILKWMLQQPFLLATALFGLMVGTAFLGKQIDAELLPQVFQGEFTLEIQLPVGTPIEQTIEILTPVEKQILEREDLGIESLLVRYGFDVTDMNRSDEGEHSARFKILLKPHSNFAQKESEVLEQLSPILSTVPDLEYRVVRPVLFSSKTPIVVEIHGDDLLQLREYGEQVKGVLGTIPEITDAESTLKRGAPEIQIAFDRDRMARFGLGLNSVATLVRDMVKGYEATEFNLKDRRIPIIARIHEKDRRWVEDVGRLTVNPGQEKPIPLSAVANIAVSEGPSEIRRIDGQRVALVEANMGLSALGGVVETIENRLDGEMRWPVDMRYFITGQSKEWSESQNGLYLALGLSLFLVYVIMAAQFESFLQPLIIMVTVPLAFLGTVVGLWTLGISFSIVVVLGMIMLAGIVVNNAIVLIDYSNTLVKRGMGLEEAVLLAGQVRLRPILMTTATTILGLLPMSLGLGDGAEIRTPMAIAVVCGLISSTVLTLVVIPVCYFWVEKALARFWRKGTLKDGVETFESLKEG